MKNIHEKSRKIIKLHTKASNVNSIYYYRKSYHCSQRYFNIFQQKIIQIKSSSNRKKKDFQSKSSIDYTVNILRPPLGRMGHSVFPF